MISELDVNNSSDAKAAGIIMESSFALRTQGYSHKHKHAYIQFALFGTQKLP